MATKRRSIYVTREEWLVASIKSLQPLFIEAGLKLPVVRISCSWPSCMIRKRVGECWTAKASKDKSRQIFITPRFDDALDVLDVVVHELLHACLPDGTGHKGAFKQGMKKLGLEGKVAATYAGPGLLKRLNAIAKLLGIYPHSALKLSEAPVKKQGTRMLKLECPGCGYIVRTTAKWVEIGLPVCVCGQTFEAEMS